MILQPSYDANYHLFFIQNVFIIIFFVHFQEKRKKKTGKMYNSDVLFV